MPSKAKQPKSSSSGGGGGPFSCCLGGQARKDKAKESKEEQQKGEQHQDSKEDQQQGASEQQKSQGEALKAGGKKGADGKGGACCKPEADSPGSSSRQEADTTGEVKQAQEKEHDGHGQQSQSDPWKAKGQMMPGSGGVRDARNLAPPSQPYDSERNTELDDGRSEADSELSAPDEDQRYYPSNSEEDQSVVDELGRKQLPKGMDMSGVETGRFKDHDNWEFDPDAPVDDNGKQILDRGKRSSEGFAKPKDIPSVTASPRIAEQEREPVPEKQPDLPEEKAGEKPKQRDISVTPPSHSNSFDSRGMSPGGLNSDQQMRPPKSPNSKASTPTTPAPSGPRYKGLVPPKKKDATPPASGTPSVVGDSGPQAGAGAAGTGADSIADNMSETSVRTSTTAATRSVVGGEDASGVSPGGRKYAGLVPPKKTDGQSKDKAGGRLGKLVPPRQSPKSPPSTSSLGADDKEQQQQGKEQQGEQAAREQKEKEQQRQEEEERREILEQQELREIQEQEREKEHKEQQQEAEERAEIEQQQRQREDEERAEIEQQQKQQQQEGEQEKGEDEQQRRQREEKEKEDEERREIEAQQREQEQKRQQQQQHEDEERAEIEEQQRRQEQRREQQEAESHKTSAHELKKPSSSEGEDHLGGEREGRASPFDPDAALAKQADKEGAQTPSPRSSAGADGGDPQAAESEHKQGSSEAHVGEGAASAAGSVAGSVAGSAAAAGATAGAASVSGGGADANGGEAGISGGLTRKSRASSSHSLDQQARLQARKAEREAMRSSEGRGEGAEGKPKPRPTALPRPGVPRYMQPTAAYEQKIEHHEEDQHYSPSPSKGPHARPTSARTASPDARGSPPPRPTTIAGVPRFMQPTAAAASLFGQTEEAKARIEAERQRHHSHERPTVSPLDKQRASRTSLASSTMSDHEHGSKIAALATSKPKPDTSHLPRFMQPTAAAQGHTIYASSDSKPAHTRFDASSAASTDEPDTSAHPESSGRAHTARTRLPNGPASTSPSPRDSQQSLAVSQNGEAARPATTPGRGSKLPTPQGAPRPASARLRAPASPTGAAPAGNLPRYMQPTAGASKQASRAQPNGPASPEEAPSGAAKAPARPTPPAKSPTAATTPPTRRAAPGASQESTRTPPGGNGTAAGQQPPAAAPPQRKQLPFGEWFVVRLTRPMSCDACKGTKEQPTVDGPNEVFKCDQMLQPKQLAVAVAHEVIRSEEEGGGAAPKTWVFCPDPLCMESEPEGSKLPPWPAKLRLHDSCKISRQEYFNLKQLGLEIAASTPATPPPATAAPAPAEAAAS